MPTRWYREKKQEHYYKIAKKEGYRARSAFKLLQIQEKYHILKRGNTVIDLGAAPGGWCQVITEIVGDGKVIAVDKEKMDSLPGVLCIRSDITKKDTIDYLQKETEDPVDAVLSDLAPNITGNYSMDHANSVWLCTHALDIAQHLLKKNGVFVCKIFDGEDLQNFIRITAYRFFLVKPFVPMASRKRSSEVYIIAKGFKGVIEPLSE